MDREIANSNIKHHTIFLGDIKNDYHCAEAAGFDKVTIHGWTEIAERKWFEVDEGIISVSRIADALKA